MTDVSELRLPASVVTKLDVARLVREVEQINDSFTTHEVRAKVGADSRWQPAPSAQLDDVLALNPINLADGDQRREFLDTLRKLKTAAPVVYMTFAGPADSESLQQIADWLRRSVHPQAVVGVGLQPDLIGGVYVRTPNHVHDLSLRARLAGHRHIITREVEALRAGR